MILKKIFKFAITLATLTAFLLVPALNLFNQTTFNSYAATSGETNIFILPVHHTWSNKSGNGGWDKKAPGTTGLILSQKWNVKDLGFEPSEVKDIKVTPYNLVNDYDWTSENFKYNHMKQMDGGNPKEQFAIKYSDFISTQNEIIFNKETNYNKKTGELIFKSKYSLTTSNTETPANSGLNLHDPLKYNGEAGAQMIYSYIGDDQPPEVRDRITEGINHGNDALRGYAYFFPYVITIITGADQDMGMSDVKLTNSQGKDVSYVRPKESHTVTFTTSHVKGDIAVGLDNGSNPKTTIDVTITDANNKTIHKQTHQAKDVLAPGGKVNIPISPIGTDTSMIKACATINPIHKAKGFNEDPSNDTICKIFATAKNYAVKELKINPHYINIPDGQSGTTQTLNFDFKVAHEGQDGFGDKPLVVVRQGSKEIMRATVTVKAGEEIQVVWPIPVNLKMGDNSFEVEVNPAPRQIIEFRSTGEDPYIDNIKRDSVVVRRNPECIECDIGVRTRNTWSERFKMVEVTGYRYYTTCTYSCGTEEEPDTCEEPCSWCVTTNVKRWEEVPTFYEEYKIKNVFFRSKWSKDTKGGDGWIDLLVTEGKIKAGYGFELKVITNYQTNRGSIPPVPNSWYDDCSYLSRSPGIGHVTNPNVISLKMPYGDGFGNNVCYLLNAENSKGSWDNNSKEYQLPLRNSFGIKTERKIYTNEDAKPGKYSIEIVTPHFDGYTPNAPEDVSNKDTMQDCKTVEFEILANDDLKTHIVQ